MQITTVEFNPDALTDPTPMHGKAKLRRVGHKHVKSGPKRWGGTTQQAIDIERYFKDHNLKVR